MSRCLTFISPTKLRHFTWILVLLWPHCADSESENKHDSYSYVTLITQKGSINLKLYKNLTPKTVKNFLQYVKSDFYNGVIFHHSQPGFMVQTGGYDKQFNLKKTLAPIPNEQFRGGISNARGTISMSRSPAPHSATSQFFFNLKHNLKLNGTMRKPGYTVFGEVTSGLDIIEAIANLPTGKHKSHPYAPNSPIEIIRAYETDKTYKEI